jgi:hypothetical protein
LKANISKLSDSRYESGKIASIGPTFYTHPSRLILPPRPIGRGPVVIPQYVGVSFSQCARAVRFIKTNLPPRRFRTEFGKRKIPVAVKWKYS